MKNVIMLITFLALAYPFSAFGQVKVFNSYSNYANGVFDAYSRTGEAGPNLENYLIVKLARAGLKTSSIDHCARF